MVETDSLKPKNDKPAWLWVVAMLCALASLIPAVLLAKGGGVPIANPWATDDQMVYAAWMRQAQDFRLFMDNRFAFEEQPGLTIHLYYFLIGIVSKVSGIFWASELCKALLCIAVTFKLYGFAGRLSDNSQARTFATVLSLFGGGLGFLVWHQFGEAIVRPSSPVLSGFSLGRLPIDVWQPEAFVFPSMLVNGLFLAALWLMLHVFEAVLDAEHSFKPVPGGFGAALLLANIHSYDVVIVGGVALLMCLAMAIQKSLTKAWIGRGCLIFAGAVPSALWLSFVLSKDPVFQSRAATETYSPNFRLVLLGLGLLIPLAYFGLAGLRDRGAKSAPIGLFIGLGVVVVLAVAAASHIHSFFLTWTYFALTFALSALATALYRTENRAATLCAAWVFCAPVLLYLPTLFQRKLAMGMAVPFALLAGIAVAQYAARQTSTIRWASLAGTGVLTCIGSLMWLMRQVNFVESDVSRTTIHPMILQNEDAEMLDRSKLILFGARILAMPGIPQMETEASGSPVPDRYVSPYLPDLNPMLSGIYGAYTFAGHWSETPDYNGKRSQATSFYDDSTQFEVKERFLRNLNIDLVLAPKPEAFPALKDTGLQNVTGLGEVVGETPRFVLIRVRSLDNN